MLFFCTEYSGVISKDSRKPLNGTRRFIAMFTGPYSELNESSLYPPPYLFKAYLLSPIYA
jgi:hypothetical protein